MLIEELFAGLGGTHPAVVAVKLGLLMVVDTVVLVGLAVPADVAVGFAAAAVGPGGAPLLALGVTAGSLTGWSVSFALGRRLGPRLRRGRAARLVAPRHWDRAGELLDGRSARLLVALQFLPVLNAVVPALAGAAGMSWARFLAHAGVGAALWAVFATKAGAALGGLGPVAALTPGAAMVTVAVLAAAVRALRSGRTPRPAP